MTIQQFVTLTLRDLEVVLSGQTPSTDQSNDALGTLNEILGNWSNEGLLVPTHALTTFAVSSGVPNYTMGITGAGATWVTAALPIKIKGAIASVATGGFQRGVAILSMEAFEASVANPIGRTAALPEKLGVDNAAPLRNVRLYPTPNNSSALIEVSYWTAMAAVALSDTVAFALPGFEEALRNELALRLANMHHIPVNQAMLLNAESSKRALSRIDPGEVTEPVGAQPQAQRPAA